MEKGTYVKVYLFQVKLYPRIRIRPVLLLLVITILLVVCAFSLFSSGMEPMKLWCRNFSTCSGYILTRFGKCIVVWIIQHSSRANPECSSCSKCSSTYCHLNKEKISHNTSIVQIALFADQGRNCIQDAANHL